MEPGFARLQESPLFFCKIFSLGKNSNHFGPRKSWKFKLKVPESPGICWDVGTVTWTWMHKYSHLHASGYCDLFLLL